MASLPRTSCLALAPRRILAASGKEEMPCRAGAFFAPRYPQVFNNACCENPSRLFDFHASPVRIQNDKTPDPVVFLNCAWLEIGKTLMRARQILDGESETDVVTLTAGFDRV